MTMGEKPGGSRAEDGVPDMTRISDMNEDGINRNLQVRFEREEIYTYTGPILVAVNPYRPLPIFESSNVLRYHGAKFGSLEPHVFALAESSYNQLQSENLNQSLVISGESGAGKTENTKFILEYLCRVTANISTWVQQQILEANNILEAFGNAKTIRNDNSSRFGRFMQVCFDSEFKIAGCVIQDYLLEQSRIIHQSGKERNYHVFYQLTAEAERDRSFAEQFHIEPPATYAYLNQSGCVKLDGVDDAERFDTLRLALEIVQINKESSDSLFAVLSAILWLGNLKYRGEQGDECDSDTAMLTSEDEKILRTIASLLEVDYDQLVQVALIRQINISGNVTEIPLKLQEAREHRHAMAKALYSRTFAWLVDHINKCTNPGKDQSRFIGILDIFGFENFETNSFEQLCINYTNEKLHMFFNHYVFKIEQEIYTEEQINFSHITFTDNTRCLEMIEKPPRCILRLLSEQCHMPQGNDKSYLANLHTEFGTHEDYVKGEDRRKWDTEFGIRHYAGSVVYKVAGFVSKNRDSQQDVFFDALLKSESCFVQELCEFRDLLSKVAQLGDVKGDGSFSKGTVKRMTNRAKPTVSDAFRLQLQVLVTVLGSTNPWYVRCIKPNMDKSPMKYDTKIVLEQLRYLGMLEIIRIKKQGFPVHYPFSDFKLRYQCLNIKQRFRIPKDEKDGVRFILKSEGMPAQDWQVGKTKVFLRSTVASPLEDKRNYTLRRSAVLIQSRWRGWHTCREYRKVRTAAKRIQDYFFAWKLRFEFIQKRRAAVVIQSYLRGMFAREVAAALREVKRVEAERKRQERLEEERQRLEAEREAKQKLEAEREAARAASEAKDVDLPEQEEDNYESFQGLADWDQSDAQQEIDKLTALADRINSQIAVDETQCPSGGVDLDQLFNFLSVEAPESVRSESIPDSGTAALDSGTAVHDSNTNLVSTGNILEDLDRQMTDLQQEMDRYSVQESIISGDTDTSPPSDSRSGEDDSSRLSGSPPPLPPPEHQPHLPHPEHQSLPLLQKPSLPEPNCPPPPPPIQNGYAFSSAAHYDQETKKAMDTLKRQKSKKKEPIYESIKPRPDPVGGSGHSPPSEYHPSPPIGGAALPPPPPGAVLPPPPPPVNGDEQYGFGECRVDPMVAKENARNISRMDGYKNGDGDELPEPPAAINRNKVYAPPPAIMDEREQYRLQRVRRELERIQELEEEAEQRKEEHHNLVEFAQNFFNEHERSPSGTIVGTIKRSKTSEMLNIHEMVSYYKGNSIPTSHIHMFDPENVSLACSIFKELNKFAKAEYKGDAEVSVIQQIIQLGLDREELRDEIYVQIMRQVTQNPSALQIENLWLLMCLIVVAFPTSKSLYKYFVSFLNDNVNTEGKIQQYVQWCLDNSTRIKVNPRKLPPSSVEIAAMRRLGTIVCRFFFLDGRTKAIDVHPCDTAENSVTKLAEKIGLQNTEGWALYETGVNREAHIPAHCYLYDIISSWEIEQLQDRTAAVNTTVNNRKSSQSSNNSTKKLSQSSDNRFIFRKRLFRNTKEIPSDLVEVSLLFAQAVHSVVRCDELPVSEKVALQLAGLQAQVIVGDPQHGNTELYSKVDMFLPQRIIASRFSSDSDWIPILMEAHAHYGSQKTELEAKVWYLRCVMQYPLYGSTLFQVFYRGYWAHGSNLVLGINAKSLLLLKADKHGTVLFQFPYSDIESILLDPGENFITLTLHPDNTKPDRQRVFTLETSSKAEIGSLVASYYPALANWIREADAPLRKVKQITNEDRTRLNTQLVNCRRALIQSNLLKKPLDDGKGFFKNTLRKLNARKLEKLRSEALTNEQGEVYKGFPHTFWAFSKSTLTQTLSTMSDQDEQSALQIFNLILTYAGLVISNKDDGSNSTTGANTRSKDEDDSHVVLIQTVLDRAMKKDCLVNEVFLQLIKQTTDHPEPNSRVNLRHWSLLALACSIILPVDKLVRKYLLAHLKKCSADFVTEEGKYARFAEKCFHKTLGTRRRQWPPSKQEILCTINRRPIYARFHFMDGQFHTVEFDPSSTADEVLRLVIQRIGLREEAQGYAIYEVLGQQERSLLGDEKVADVMSKWDKYQSAGGTLSRQSKHHMFLFKKHLFLDEYIDLRDPVEKELLYYQALCDLRSDRFPVTDMEAVMLCALRAQIELSDYSGEGDYRQVMAHCLPPRMMVNIHKERVAMHHQSLIGMSVEEAKQAFLNLIQCWPLHRATLFDVNQTFTSNWPRSLWLGVDQRGVHLLEARTRNVLTSYEYDTVIDFTPSINHLLLITGNDKKQSKVILNTTQAFQIANLIREYNQVVVSSRFPEPIGYGGMMEQ